MSDSLRRDWLAAHQTKSPDQPKGQMKDDPASSASMLDTEGLFKKKKAPTADKPGLSSPPPDFLEENPPEEVVKTPVKPASLQGQSFQRPASYSVQDEDDEFDPLGIGSPDPAAEVPVNVNPNPPRAPSSGTAGIKRNPSGEGDNVIEQKRSPTMTSQSNLSGSAGSAAAANPTPPSRQNYESVIVPGQTSFNVAGLQKKENKYKTEAAVHEEKLAGDPEHETIIKFDNMHALGPRGTFDIEFKRSYMMLSRDHRREYYAMPYENITSMIQLERIENETSEGNHNNSGGDNKDKDKDKDKDGGGGNNPHAGNSAIRVIILHLREGVKSSLGGSASWRYFVLQFVNPPPVRILFHNKILEERKDAIVKEMGSYLHKGLDVNGWIALGSAADIFPCAVSVFAGVPANLPNNYARISYQQGNQGSMDGALRCAYKEKYDGFLYLLDDAFVFLENPLIIIKFSALLKAKHYSITFHVPDMNATKDNKKRKPQPFDFGITVADARDTYSQHIFTQINPREFAPMRKFLTDNNLTYTLSTHTNPCCFFSPKTKKVFASDEGM